MDEIRILHDDVDFFVIDKPSGLATQGGVGIKNSVENLMEKRLGQKIFFGSTFGQGHCRSFTHCQKFKGRRRIFRNFAIIQHKKGLFRLLFRYSRGGKRPLATTHSQPKGKNRVFPEKQLHHFRFRNVLSPIGNGICATYRTHPSNSHSLCRKWFAHHWR